MNQNRIYRRNRRAVSPVVATLILILIVVAAGAALYLWAAAWEGSTTRGIGDPGTQWTLTIGGATNAQPFDALAITQFEANHSGVAIANNGGGTTGGMLAVCRGNVDIGVATSAEALSDLQTIDRCPSTATVTKVAYDAVEVILPSANPAGIQSMNQSVLLSIYVAASPVSSVTSGIQMPWYGANVLGLTAGRGVHWNWIPTTAGCGNAGAPVCNYSTDRSLIDTVGESAVSGATQVFESRLLGATSSNATAANASDLSANGCGLTGLLSDCGIAPITTTDGDPAMITVVAGDPNAIGYSFAGPASANGSGVETVDFAGPGQTCASLSAFPPSEVSNCGVIPTTSTILAGIYGSNRTANYVGWTPIEFVTTVPPSGEVAQFVQWILGPSTNQAIAAESGKISVFAGQSG